MTRFTHWDRPLAYPFFDVVNRDTGGGGCFDLSVLLEDYTGSLFLRDEHVIEMGRSLGMATITEVDALNARIKELEAERDRLPKAQEELKSGLDSLVSDFQRNLRGDVRSDSVEPPVGNTEPAKIDAKLSEPERETSNPFSL